MSLPFESELYSQSTSSFQSTYKNVIQTNQDADYTEAKDQWSPYVDNGGTVMGISV